MAKRKGMRAEEFRSSFGVNAFTPDPYTPGKTVSTPLDDEDPQEPMGKLDDKGSGLETKSGMMNEIMRVLRKETKDKVAETYSRIVEEDEKTSEESHEDDDDTEKEADKEVDKEVKEFYSLYGYDPLYEEDEKSDDGDDDTKVDIHIDGR